MKHYYTIALGWFVGILIIILANCNAINRKFVFISVSLAYRQYAFVNPWCFDVVPTLRLLES